MNYDARFIDLHTAINEVRIELQQGPPVEHMDLVEYVTHQSPSYCAFATKLRTYTTTDTHSSPDLFQGQHLHRGAAFGIYITQKVLGWSAEEELARQIEQLLTVDTNEPQVYADYLTGIGAGTYTRSLSSHSFSASLTGNPLRQFTDYYANELYGAYNLQQQPFKVGVGLARSAYNEFSRSIDTTLSGITSATESARP